MERDEEKSIFAQVLPPTVLSQIASLPKPKPGTDAWWKTAVSDRNHLTLLRDLPETTKLEAAVAEVQHAISETQNPMRKRGLIRYLETARYKLELGRERDAAQATRPSDCWCLGLGGRHELAIEQLASGDIVYGYIDYCPCPDGELAREIANEARSRVASERAATKIRRVLTSNSNFEAYEGLTLDTWIAAAQQATGVHLRNSERVMKLRRWPSTWNWLYLYGDFGAGKTGLLCSLTQSWMYQHPNASVYLAVAPDLLNRIQRSYGVKASRGETTEQVMEALTEVDLLAIDDIGNEYGTEWARRTLWQVINARYNRLQKPVALTSNLSPEQVSTQYGVGLADRIVERATLVYLEGINLRAGSAG